jgi:ABC-type phosphate/phosphonate transport system substrate-binding protein
LTHALQGKVQLVGCFHYAAPGCDGMNCRSVLIARNEHASLALEGFRQRRVAFNSADSQSGYNALRALVAPLAWQGRFFSQALVTGDHRQSVDAVREGRADLAAIDCVTWALLQKYAPQASLGLQAIGYSAPYPGLPLISAIGRDAREVAALRSALRAVAQDPAARPHFDALLITGFESPAISVYQRCLDMEHQAIAQGFPVLN